jgi:hypothetical protein
MRPQNITPNTNAVFLPVIQFLPFIFRLRAAGLDSVIIQRWNGGRQLHRITSHRPLKHEKHFCFIEKNKEKSTLLYLTLAPFVLIYVRAVLLAL